MNIAEKETVISANNVEIAKNVSKVYEAGKKSEYDAFWDGIQNSGNRERYEYAFVDWDVEYIRPKYKVVPNSSSRNLNLFYNNSKLKKIESKYFDFSNHRPNIAAGVNGNYLTFANCPNLEEIEDVGINGGGYYSTYSSNQKLKKIAVMRCVEGGAYSEPFRGCESLTDIIIEGVISTNFPIRQSPLTVESLKSIITHLKDYSGTDKEYTYTVTFKATAFAELEAEGTTSPHGNTWAKYIDDLKWKLTKV